VLCWREDVCFNLDQIQSAWLEEFLVYFLVILSNGTAILISRANTVEQSLQDKLPALRSLHTVHGGEGHY
jgi:hypothetical protein